MSTIDLDALEATARAATPGPWMHQPYGGQNQNGDYFGGDVFDADGEYLLSEVANEAGAHIATFDPPTVRALIARLRTAENALKNYDANFPCDGGCNVNDGPAEECSRDGRSPREWIERGDILAARLREAEAGNNDALGFIDQTVYANDDNRPDLKWTNTEVLELLGVIRDKLAAPADVDGRDQT